MEHKIQKRVVYICTFWLKGATFVVKSTNGLEAFKDGFWINNEKELTNGSDCTIWIPPHQIQYIIKEHE